MAYDFIKANASRIGLDRDIASYDVNVQVMSLMQGKDSADLGVALFIAMVSALVGAVRAIGRPAKVVQDREHGLRGL